jgi:type IV pilus assembly protein PilB
MKERPLLGSILCARQRITQDQLKEALKIHMRTGKSLGRVLIDLAYVTSEEICEALGVQHELPTVLLKNIPLSETILNEVPSDVVEAYDVIPVSLENDILTLAVSDLMNIVRLDDLKFILGKDIHLVLTSDLDLSFAKAKYYQIITPEEDEKNIHSFEVMEELVQVASEETPVIELVNLVLSQSIRDMASDIHFESLLDCMRVRCRMDGLLVEVMTIPTALSAIVISRIKVMCEMDIAETRLPQDGRIDFSIGDKVIDLRVATLSTIYGESLVIRVLDKGSVALSLRDLGLSQEDEMILQQFLMHPSGVVLTTGPTGSGKTTTIYALLKELNHVSRKIITVEDPIEYEVDGVIQIAVKAKIGLTFSQCLRHILRQDPDILMVGEIRDEETMSMSIQSALTGHLVLSTLHTNDTVGSITRLLDMGIEPFLITSTVNVVMAQRLVRKLCSYCKEEDSPRKAFLHELEIDNHDVSLHKFYAAVGCDRCQMTGYRGRIGIFEVLKMSSKVKTLILKSASANVIRETACQEGMRLLRDDGLAKVFAGITSLDELVQEGVAPTKR